MTTDALAMCIFRDRAGAEDCQSRPAHDVPNIPCELIGQSTAIHADGFQGARDRNAHRGRPRGRSATQPFLERMAPWSLDAHVLDPD
ncbi:hypothetical protein C8Q70DRAFT_959289 [Cubamyces menziesii]|nr:hypothetical protein C8Q70DRAFT_959289 [Cubamyces menziesii]